MQPNNATVATAIAHNTLVTGPTFRRTTKRLPPFAAHPPRVSCTSIQALSGRFGWSISTCPTARRAAKPALAGSAGVARIIWPVLL
jgi:hypothetical protein